MSTKLFSDENFYELAASYHKLSLRVEGLEAIHKSLLGLELKKADAFSKLSERIRFIERKLGIIDDETERVNSLFSKLVDLDVNAEFAKEFVDDATFAKAVKVWQKEKRQANHQNPQPKEDTDSKESERQRLRDLNLPQPTPM